MQSSQLRRLVLLFIAALNIELQEMKQELIRDCYFATQDAPSLRPFPPTVQSQCNVHAYLTRVMRGLK